ncbi:MAG: ABC transporter ATP-binding protein [Bacillota bacterium]
MVRDEKLLQIKDLKISFKNGKDYIQVVRGVDLDVNKGEIIGILGESGSGKTVSANSIIGLLDGGEGRIDSGEIYFLGTDLLTLKEKEMEMIRGKEISYIFQNPTESLNPYQRVGKQIEEALKIHGMSASREKVIEVMKDVGLDTADIIYNMYPFQLSGGQCQRIMIAMGIVCSPKLLIADEPTSAIDASLRKKILGLLESINQKYGTSIIIITHDFDVVKYLCNKITIMYGGLVMEQGDMEDILENPLHPYTEELLKCVDSLYNMDTVLYALDGRPPHPYEFRNECPFYERCKKKTKECSESIPPMVEYHNRSVRCVNVIED